MFATTILHFHLRQSQPFNIEQLPN